jgi:uncharacterized protein YcbX
VAVPSVARISTTPVKSTALRHPESVRLEAWGAVGNRTFYLCDRDGRMVTGTRFGHLVRIGSDVVDGELRLTFPDGGAVVARPEPTGDLVTTDFYGRAVTGRVAPGPWDGPLRALTGIDVRLVVPDADGAANDVEPITLVSLASVADLAWRSGAEDLDPRRFRMTFDLDGCEPFEEDTWDGRRVRIGAALIEIGTAVPRCVVTTQDPATGDRDFPTLVAIKRARAIPDGSKLPFGVYARVLEPGTVRVGDRLEVVA